MVERVIIPIFDINEWGVLAAALDSYAQDMATRAENERRDAPDSLDAAAWARDAQIAQELLDNLNAGKYAAEADDA